ncbi:MAG: cytochrome c oxidase subunit II [Dehalococcoidia bacterium]|nr:cytochrome c oxidase subunit II [Dehalococcoidia bacterium]
MPASNRPFFRMGLFLGILSFGLLLVGCYPTHFQSTFDAAGYVAEKQLTLFYYIFWAMAFVFVAFFVALLYTVLRFRRRQGHDEIPRQVHGHTPLEIAWTVPPFLLLAVVAVPAISVLFELDTPPADAMEVNVIGHQWWWEFEYPEQPGILTAIVTANELHIPVGKPVKFTMTSTDVIHSFWVPKLAGKQDIIPTRKIVMWFQADRASPEGGFYGQCAEFCGLSHANMRLRVIAEAPDQFEQWVKGQQTPSKPAVELAGLAAEGANLFANVSFEGGQRCVFCHTVQGQAIQGKVGPNLTHVGSRGLIAAGILDNTSEDLGTWLQNPPGVKPGAKMPNLLLTDDQIEKLVAYLQSLR